MAHQSPKIIMISHISPAKDTVPTTTLPLTFFDIMWLTLVPNKSIFFFNYRETTDHFIKHFIPNLKHSLSITLQHFYPYAGNVIYPPGRDVPFIRYIDGEDSLLFILAESLGLDFDDLISDQPKKAEVLYNFMPKLPPIRISPDGTETRPAMVIQVTIFPGTGISIGIISSHIVDDGVTFMHFMKYWMSLCKSESKKGETVPDQFESPREKDELKTDFEAKETTDPMTRKSNGMILPLPAIHSCRNIIKDPNDIATDYINCYWNRSSENNNGYSNVPPPPNMVRTTFLLTRLQTNKLKSWVKEKSTIDESTFVVILAFAWSILIKTLMENQETDKDEDENNKFFNFVFGIDCRNRLKYEETTIPSNYFGNCIIPCYVVVKKQELLGENSVLAASKAISTKMKEVLLPDGILKKEPIAASKSLIAIAGAPKLGFYDLDFGLGKACKVEIVHIDVGRIISVLESRDGFNGVEIGLALEQDKMDTFGSILEREISKFDM